MCQDCQFLGFISDLLNQNLLGWRPAICCCFFFFKKKQALQVILIHAEVWKTLAEGKGNKWNLSCQHQGKPCLRLESYGTNTSWEIRRGKEFWWQNSLNVVILKVRSTAGSFHYMNQKILLISVWVGFLSLTTKQVLTVRESFIPPCISKWRESPWALVLKVWSPDKQHQYHQGTWLKIRYQTLQETQWIRVLGVEPSNLCFNKPCRWFWCPLKFENHQIKAPSLSPHPLFILLHEEGMTST